jgi:hypothetical protein
MVKQLPRKMVNGRLSGRAKSAEHIETLVERAWRAFGAAYEPLIAAMHKTPKTTQIYTSLSRLRQSSGNPIMSIGTSTRQYGTYSKCKPVRPVTRRVRYHV